MRGDQSARNPAGISRPLMSRGQSPTVHTLRTAMTAIVRHLHQFGLGRRRSAVNATWRSVVSVLRQALDEAEEKPRTGGLWSARAARKPSCWKQLKTFSAGENLAELLWIASLGRKLSDTFFFLQVFLFSPKLGFTVKYHPRNGD